MTTKVVKTIMGQAVPAPTKPMAMNWADPANTKSDIPIVPAADNPALVDSVPKIIPNGMAPITRGSVSRTPAQNSDRRVVKAMLWVSFMNGTYHMFIGLH